MFFSPFSIAITLLGEERAKGLWFVIVALPETVLQGLSPDMVPYLETLGLQVQYRIQRHFFFQIYCLLIQKKNGKNDCKSPFFFFFFFFLRGGGGVGWG